MLAQSSIPNRLPQQKESFTSVGHRCFLYKITLVFDKSPTCCTGFEILSYWISNLITALHGHFKLSALVSKCSTKSVTKDLTSALQAQTILKIDPQREAWMTAFTTDTTLFTLRNWNLTFFQPQEKDNECETNMIRQSLEGLQTKLIEPNLEILVTVEVIKTMKLR